MMAVSCEVGYDEKQGFERCTETESGGASLRHSGNPY